MAEKANYQQLNEELEDILGQLQAGNLSVDDAIQTFERGQTIIKQLEKILKTAENKIKKLPTK